MPMSNAEKACLCTIEEGIAWITMNRPDTLNAYSVEMLQSINEVITYAEENPEVKVLVLTGQGRAFSSGGMLQELDAMNKDRLRAIFDVDLTADMVRHLYNVKKPVIAALNGPAYGAGIATAMACDIIIASENAEFGFSFTKLGFCPDSGSTWFLTQRVGYNKACEILFSAATLKAPDLLELGLVNKVVPADEFGAAVSKQAEKLAAGPALALMLQKRVLRNAVSTSFEQNRDYEAVTQIFASQTDDCAEGLTAALNRRKPEFIGR